MARDPEPRQYMGGSACFAGVLSGLLVAGILAVFLVMAVVVSLVLSREWGNGSL